MSITENDKNNYFAGFLMLIRIEGTVTESSKNFMNKVANILGYNHYFVEHSIVEISEHIQLIQDPPKFTSHSFAEIFIRDSMRLVFKNNVINLDAIRWLSEATQKNDLSKQWFYLELENFLDNYSPDISESFEIQKHVEKVYS